MAVLLTIKDGYASSYRFPLDTDDRARGKALTERLQEVSGSLPIDELHDFVRPFLYPKPTSALGEESSKWKNVIECFFAIDTLRDDGNFKAAHEVTQMFAISHNHIRGAMLYHGLKRTLSENDNNAYKYEFFLYPL